MRTRELELPDLAGRRVLVTGASDGIGFEIARRVSAAGASLILPFRDPGRGAAAMDRLRRDNPDTEITTIALDLASQTSVRAAAAELRRRDDDIHVFVANAGIMATPQRVLTEDGFELQMATNHLGHAALIAGVMPILSRSGARITSMSSAAAKSGRPTAANLQSDPYSPVRAYMDSKLAQMVFALELERRSARNGWGITSNVAHPGTTATNLYSAGPSAGTSRRSPIAAVVHALARARILVQMPEAGALPALLASVGGGLGGRFYGPDGPGHFSGSAAEQRIYPAAADADLARRVWDYTRELTAVDWPPSTGSHV